MGLDHEHILPFLGIADDVFPGTVCMVVNWMENGSLRQYLKTQLQAGKLPDDSFEQTLVKWARFS